MSIDHSEKGFESAVTAHLLTGGYVAGDPATFDAKLALDPSTLVRFLQASQPKEWARLVSIYGAEVEGKVVGTIARDLDQRGMLECLRHGVTDRGVKLRLAFFQPATGLNPETQALYEKNILTVARQVHFSDKQGQLSVDLLLAVNGLPIATAELKNPFTRQTVVDAQRQYREDRDPREPLFQFKKRCLVHFAVDPDEVHMTTRLEGKKTVFLPFNKGRDGGKGNPDNPGGYKTAYLWEEVWRRDSWLDILARFVHLEVKEKIVAKEKVKIESVVFPRYHQLDAVRKLVGAAKTNGPGRNYLVQHSAGSGKSNTIAWVAHRLSNLHDDNDKLVYDSVIVITDRKVLDRQLQDTIYQFEHAQGVVQRIDDNSAQLGDALAAGAKIIITTLQKFSFVLDRVKELPKRRYALIVDEAHSSQTGESASNLRRVLTVANLEDAEKEDAPAAEADEVEEEILRTIQARGPQKDLSYFAFTATPKHKTLEMFGTPGAGGKPLPFHLYSMRQAIEEGFILDVLKNYTTYATYYRLAKAVADDPEVDRKKATQAVARFVSLHPHNLAQKTEVMVEHFRGFTRKKIGGKAKAMLVTRSRLHAVRYKQAFDKYLKEKGYDDIGVLVAFSGTVDDGGVDYTEPGMNGIAMTRLPEEFAGDKYQILIVAEKYQTGFDQPLLHTMFVDKKLDGLQAVQTLSRLNRTCGGKEDTFVLDFVNDAEDVKEAFKPFFEQTQVEECVDPNLLYTLKNKLDGVQVYYAQEVLDFARVFFKPLAKQREQDQGLLHKHIDPAVHRFGGVPEERQVEFRHQLGTFLRLYAFLAQIVDFHDPDLERLYAFGRLLITKLKIGTEGGTLDIEDDVKLAYYRLSMTHEGSVSLSPGDTTMVSGPTDVGTGRPGERDTAKLSEIVTVLNDRFGTDFTASDQLWFDQIIEDMTGDEELGDQARTNPIDNFKLEFNPKVMEAVVSRIERNENIATTFLTNEDLREVAIQLMMEEVYQRLQAAEPAVKEG
jgi:type I restriction enzyme R subunit